jgi:chromosome partitioning protein
MLKNPANKELILANFLDDVRSQYDIILIDCPPTDSMLTTAAYLASDSVLIPVKPEFLSTIGLPLLVRSLEDFQDIHRSHSIKVLGIVFNAASEKLEHERSRATVRKTAKEHGWYVFKNEVSFSDSYPKGSRLGRPIFLTEYARNNKKRELYAVGNEFLARVKS